MAGFGVVTLVLYVDVSAGELALFAACSAAGYVVEALVAGVSLRRAAEPVRSWLAGERRDESTLQAWSAAVGLPVARLRRPSLYAIGPAVPVRRRWSWPRCSTWFVELQVEVVDPELVEVEDLSVVLREVPTSFLHLDQDARLPLQIRVPQQPGTPLHQPISPGAPGNRKHDAQLVGGSYLSV